MTQFNITQAAKVAGVSRVTVQRHIKQGKLSCELNEQGRKLIGVAELIRVYGELQSPDTPNAVNQNDAKIQREAPHVAPMLHQRINSLEEEIERLHKEKERDHDEYRQREERLLQMLESEQQKTQTLMLEHHSSDENPSKSGDRWLVWSLAAFTVIVGAIAIAAIYYLQAGS